MAELVAGDFTGVAERAWVRATLGDLAGGRVYKTQVPAGVTLPTDANGRVKPYIILRFAEPVFTRAGRSIAGTEQEQPHLMSFTVLVYGGDDDAVEAVMVAVRRRLVGFRPSTTATDIQGTGGTSLPNVDDSGATVRFEYVAFFRTTINL